MLTPRVPSAAGYPSRAVALSVSLALSALRLFTLLIPQHPPRNNDVRPCFSCFSLSLSPSLSLILLLSPLRTSLFLTAYLFSSLVSSCSFPSSLFPSFPTERPDISRGWRKIRGGVAYLQPDPVAILSQERGICPGARVFSRAMLGKCPDESPDRRTRRSSIESVEDNEARISPHRFGKR